MLISGDKSLEEFRRLSLSGRRLLLQLGRHGNCLRIDLPVGVGKSHAMDVVIQEAILSDAYDLVIVLTPTREILEERSWIRVPPENILIANLRPRSSANCGKARNAQWVLYEKQGLGTLGRVEICENCPRQSKCFWPKQYGKNLLGTRVVYGTQTHLEINPTFVDQIQEWAGAARVLVLLDEGNFILSPFRRVIRRRDLEQFAKALRISHERKSAAVIAKWADNVDLLLIAATDDLRRPHWSFPRLYPPSVLRIQSTGVELFGEQFRYLGNELSQFGRSHLDSRAKLSGGHVRFAAPPAIGQDFIIFSGTASHEFAKYRLGVDFESPFAGYRFEHPETRWYNLASKTGMRSYFPGNAKQILDFFADLIGRRLRQSKRPLLVSRKRFLPMCLKGIQERLVACGLGDYCVVDGRDPEIDLAVPTIIPIINFGMIGTNRFEQFDGAYCLNGFYVNEPVVNSILQDVLAEDFQLPLKIETKGSPRRRRAGTANPEDRYYDVHRLAQLALDQQEMDVVLQAVGRVRPYTRPREVFTFQCAGHPTLDYHQEFDSLAAARQFFGIDSRRQTQKKDTVQRVQEAKEQGMTQVQAAECTGLGLRTVKRYWKG